MFDHFYHQIFRKTVIAFGTLFNGITIHRDGDASDDPSAIIKVPLAYGPTQKFLARIEQQPDLNKPVSMSLPRMSFEFTGIEYDTSRKLGATQTFTTAIKTDKKDVRKIYMPVPYNMAFELNIMTLLNDDALQIVEQILPYFQPNYTVTIDLVESIGEKKDIPITLENVAFEDNYEGDYTQRRVLLYTLNFTAKTYLFGPVPVAPKDLIKKVSVGITPGERSAAYGSGRQITYATPVATKNYTGDVIANLAEDVLAGSTIIPVDDPAGLAANTFIDVNNETMYIESITDNKLNVKRASYNTTAIEHVRGSDVKGITSTDNALIEAGDDFGFSGT